MRLFRSLALCLLASTSILCAAGKIFPYAYTQEDLPNGLRLITIPTDYPNIVSLFIVVGAGSRNEVTPGKTGFAHLFEHLMFRGTAEYPPEKYTAVLQSAGAASNAFTSTDLTAYHTTFSKEDLPKILSMEADRFQHLEYSEADFKTESLAVLGEFNKDIASPDFKLDETMQGTAYKVHPYSHTTMGYLKDVQNMPEGYQYSRDFFAHYYRPEYVTIIVAGDVNPKQVRSLIDERWGQWKRGSYKPTIPAEPTQDGPRRAHVDWTTDTIPLLAVAWHGPAYSDDTEDTAALDAIAHLGYDQNSSLYQKLVVEDQKVEEMYAEPPSNLDPGLFEVDLHVKDAKDLPSIESQVKAVAQSFSEKPVDAQKLEQLKEHMRYEFALSLNNSEAIASTVASFVALRRTPETINRYYDMIAKLTPADIQRVAKKYLVDKNLDVVTLTHDGGAK
ncbi:MAG TPA: pitrilysin family protein [Bryobacteraceae bacterium]|nr:pitrilysin family protein [Bryobacteraceae bacterium]